MGSPAGSSEAIPVGETRRSGKEKAFSSAAKPSEADLTRKTRNKGTGEESALAGSEQSGLCSESSDNVKRLNNKHLFQRVKIHAGDEDRIGSGARIVQSHLFHAADHQA